MRWSVDIGRYIDLTRAAQKGSDLVGMPMSRVVIFLISFRMSAGLALSMIGRRMKQIHCWNLLVKSRSEIGAFCRSLAR